jgi:hypothetical protein
MMSVSVSTLLPASSSTNTVGERGDGDRGRAIG